MPLEWVFNNRPVLIRLKGEKGNSNKLPEERSSALSLNVPQKELFPAFVLLPVGSCVPCCDITLSSLTCSSHGPRASQQEPYWMAGSR